MSLALVLDGVIVVLLVLTIGFAAMLDRRLRRLRAGESELAGLIGRLNESTAATEASLTELKAYASAVDGRIDPRQLDQRIDKATGLAEDLAYLVQRGEQLADQLAETVSTARKIGASGRLPATRRPEARAGAPAAAAQAPRSAAERELLEALKGAR